MHSFLNLSDNNKFLKSIIIGIFTTVSLTVILMCVVTVVLYLCSLLAYEYMSYIMICIVGISIFTGSYTGARVNKHQGMIIGLTIGLIILCAMIIIGFCLSYDNLSINTIMRIVIVMLCSVSGGIKGVNVKEKIHIK